MSRHHTAVKWTAIAPKARRTLAQQLPLPCHHCRRPVMPEDTWDVAHIHDLAEGGDAHNYTVAHRSCNRKDGGRKGAAITNEKRKQFRKW